MTERVRSGEPGGLELALARVLQVGTYASVGLIAIGSVLLLANRISPTSTSAPLAITSIAGDLVALRPAGYLWLGIIGVLATPGLRVARALLGFWRRGERSMALVAAAVLVVIAIGVIVGVMAG